MTEISSIAMFPKIPLPRTPSITYCKKSRKVRSFPLTVDQKYLALEQAGISNSLPT
jgi:hypothetical protein